jgi:hypothetical protein
MPLVAASATIKNATDGAFHGVCLAFSPEATCYTFFSGMAAGPKKQ